MSWDKTILDVTLVPCGLILLLLYHVQLVYRILKHPTSTVIGVNDLNRRVWVRIMMKDSLKNGILAVQTLRNNIMASTLLATAAITLSSLIAVLVSNNRALYESNFIFGNRSNTITSLKLLLVLVCFLVAFLCNVQSIRYYSHVSFLISIPIGDNAPGLTPEYVNRAMTRGTHFWSIGLRSFYVSFPLFLWLFGPLPMFICSIVVTILLHHLDTARDFRETLHSNIEDDINQVI